MLTLILIYRITNFDSSNSRDWWYVMHVMSMSILDIHYSFYLYRHNCVQKRISTLNVYFLLIDVTKVALSTTQYCSWYLPGK